MTSPDAGLDRDEPTWLDEWTVSRRNVLKTGAVTTSALALGGTGASGSAAARGQGGAGFMTAEDYNKPADAERTFRLLPADGWTLDHAAGCGGKKRGPPKEYVGYLIQFATNGSDPSDPPPLGHLYVEPNRRVEVGVWQDITAARTCPPDGTVTDERGTDEPHPVHRVVFQPIRFGESPSFGTGDGVVDTADPDPDPAIVIAVFDIPISDWVVYGDETVAHQNSGYDPKERVAIVSFEHLLEAGWQDWRDAEPESLFDEVVDRGIKFHAFPASRLE